MSKPQRPQSVRQHSGLSSLPTFDTTDYAMEPLDHVTPPPPHHRRKFVLCFDGTGNKFSGTDADSSILKIYRMLDRTDHTQFHYYQPGIGTYVTSSSLSHTGRLARFRSWYMKGKDSMFGTSLADHVMGGYRFLMRYYRDGDEIYLFGFSRGAYTARFLAEMMDHVGLLSQGNEELIRFAWKTFQKWQMRRGFTEKETTEKKYLLQYMFAFRETFSRPVKPIKFLGLFDTVNSVPQFENALMSRTKFPYTAHSSALVIRHAVSIGERRAKFRQDLIGLKRHHHKDHHKHKYRAIKKVSKQGSQGMVGDQTQAREKEENEHSRRNEEVVGGQAATGVEEEQRGRHTTLQVPSKQFRDHSEVAGIRSLSPNLSMQSGIRESDVESLLLFQADDEEEGEQDIQEVWFSGGHADIGGGWPLEDGEEVASSHIPLVWMVREAARAGLRFDEVKMRALNCAPEEHQTGKVPKLQAIPRIIEPSNTAMNESHDSAPIDEGGITETPAEQIEESQSDDINIDELPVFHRKLALAATKSRIHDVLRFGNGINAFGVMAWNFMEYLPLRRMDLQDDGSWKPITWPLPKGEVRDIPDDVVVHNSVIRRMLADTSYRPGNLILGGGGRGVRVAPPEFGIGKWKVFREEGDWIGECYVRAEKPVGSKFISTNGIKKFLEERKKSQ